MFSFVSLHCLCLWLVIASPGFAVDFKPIRRHYGGLQARDLLPRQENVLPRNQIDLNYISGRMVFPLSFVTNITIVQTLGLRPCSSR